MKLSQKIIQNLLKNNSLEEAEGILLQHQDQEAFHYLAIIYQQQGNYSLAKEYIEKSLASNPFSADYYNTLAGIQFRLEEFQNALDSLKKSLYFSPSANAYNNQAMAFMEMRQYEDALTSYETALELAPHAAHIHFNYALALLLLGDSRGWQEYEWRHELLGHKFFHIPNNLEELRGKRVLLQHEQGLGDTLQFIRYANELKKLDCQISLACPDSLQRLLPYPIMSCYDWVIPLMSLPRLFGIIPNDVYIQPPSENFEEICQLIRGKSFKVGVVWGSFHPLKTDFLVSSSNISPSSANLVHWSAQRRSFSPELLLPWNSWKGVRLYSLQKGQPSLQLPADLQILDLAPYLNDFADTAAAISRLDLVLTIDTSVAHLAGGMGKRTWLLLPYSADWRWGVGDETIWYPSMKIFRQTERNNWEEVLNRVYWELKSFLR